MKTRVSAKVNKKHKYTRQYILHNSWSHGDKELWLHCSKLQNLKVASYTNTSKYYRLKSDEHITYMSHLDMSLDEQAS